MNTKVICNLKYKKDKFHQVPCGNKTCLHGIPHVHHPTFCKEAICIWTLNEKAKCIKITKKIKLLLMIEGL